MQHLRRWVAGLRAVELPPVQGGGGRVPSSNSEGTGQLQLANHGFYQEESGDYVPHEEEAKKETSGRPAHSN